MCFFFVRDAREHTLHVQTLGLLFVVGHNFFKKGPSQKLRSPLSTRTFQRLSTICYPHTLVCVRGGGVKRGGAVGWGGTLVTSGG
jgi:hypothetical protein